MRENEFERKVQEQLEDLRIRPSDETWAKLEKELKEKKKRRVAVLFFLLAGLLLVGYSGYTFLYKRSTQPVVQNKATQKNSSIENTETPNNKNTAVAQKPVITPSTNLPIDNGTVNQTLKNEPMKKNSVAAEQTSSERPNQQGLINPDKNQKPVIEKNQPPKTPSFEFIPSSTAKKTIGSKPGKKGIVQKENDPVLTDRNEEAVVANPVDQIGKQPVQEPADNNVIANSNSIVSNTTNKNNKDKQLPADSVNTVDNAIAKLDINKTDVPVTEEPKPEIAKTKNNRKLKFGVEFSGGNISSHDRVFGFIDLGGFKSMEVNAPSNMSQSTNPGGNNPRVIIPPSEIKAGRAWKAGLVAEMAISKRSSISAGLRYAYYDESLRVGSIRDTVIRSNSYSFAQNFLVDRGVRGAYSAAAAPPVTRTKYTNRYQFLELPLLYQTQLNKGKKMGILLNGGIVPGFMFGTNALVYDTTAGGIYYKNDKAFKRFHFNLQTGLAFQFGNNKKIQWSVGPTVSLDMTRLMKEDVFTEKRYFLYTGLTGKLFFSRGKK